MMNGNDTVAKNQTTPKIVIDDVEYNYAEMSPEQQTLVNHVVDIDRKIQSAMFQLDQFKVGKDAFIAMLKQALIPPVNEQVPQDVVIKTFPKPN
jgi:hypothetical protein